jgi:hypothetical protein
MAAWGLCFRDRNGKYLLAVKPTLPVDGKSRNRKLATTQKSLRNRRARSASREHAFHELSIFQNGDAIHQHELDPC